MPQEGVNRTNEPVVGVPVRKVTEDGVEVQVACSSHAGLPVPQLTEDALG